MGRQFGRIGSRLRRIRCQFGRIGFQLSRIGSRLGRIGCQFDRKGRRFGRIGRQLGASVDVVQRECAHHVDQIVARVLHLQFDVEGVEVVIHKYVAFFC